MMTGPATFENGATNAYRLTPICRKCWHTGQTRSPAEWVAIASATMQTPTISVQAGLVCSACGQRAGYFHIENPYVTAPNHAAPNDTAVRRSRSSRASC